MVPYTALLAFSSTFLELSRSHLSFLTALCMLLRLSATLGCFSESSVHQMHLYLFVSAQIILSTASVPWWKLSSIPGYQYLFYHAEGPCKSILHQWLSPTSINILHFVIAHSSYLLNNVTYLICSLFHVMENYWISCVWVSGTSLRNKYTHIHELQDYRKVNYWVF